MTLELKKRKYKFESIDNKIDFNYFFEYTMPKDELIK